MSQELKEHLKKDHFISKSSEYIWEIVYGGIDGIVTTFAVVAWFAWAGATNSLWEIWPLAVVLFWLANLFGDGVSMWLWKYLSTKSEQDIYHRERNKEVLAAKNYPEREYNESIEILTEQWVNVNDAWQLINIMKQYPDLRIKWQMDNELEISDVRWNNAIIQWIITIVSFIFFWAIPLIPYIFMDVNSDLWMTSIIMTWSSLILLWIVRRYVTKMNFFKTVSQMVILGTVAAAVAYWTWDIVMKIQG